jgi:hypothetical protein
MKRAENQLDAQQVLSVVESYSTALDILDDYDHQTLAKPRGNRATYVLTYDECRSVIDKMTFVSDSNLFGNEKDDSFKGSIGAIYQSFDGKDLYPSLEEKAAVVLKWWCRQNNIPYNNDMDNIEAAYRWYYKCEEEGDNYSLIYHLAMH